jgi:hypothetical protein
MTGSDWKPPVETRSPSDNLSKSIAEQGNLVRDLKAKDPKSAESKAAIAKLLDLKKQFKEMTGSDWKPPVETAPSSDNLSKPSVETAPSSDNLSKSIAKQGNLVRDLKAKDPKSAESKAAIAKLLDLKKQFKEMTGSDWKPPVETAPSSDNLSKSIAEQGNLVRDLKAKDPKSAESKAAIAKLLDLKKQFKEMTGSDWKPSA